jgi:Flp pilus assembly pilin Flp
MKIRQITQSRRRGAALIEYGLLVAGVALISSAAVAVFGHKTNDLVAATAAILPGAHADDNGAMFSGKLIETSDPAGGPIAVDTAAVLAGSSTSRLSNNLLGAGGDITTLVID